MISAIYAGILALLIVWLSLNVIKLRRANKVKLGDGGVPELQNAIRAQGNAAEYIPISLILLVLLELSGTYLWMVNLAGVALIIGRIIHAKGLLTENLRYRVLGMQLTIFTIVGLATVNIFYNAYKLL
ncbi:MAG: MAPEG family protein [Methylococcaceae bacterium]|nr:MAPEG family protein [Methylococcaceae bacterium]